MKKQSMLQIIGLLVLFTTALAPRAAFSAEPLRPDQLLVVVTGSWGDSRGKLYRFERHSSAWQRLNGRIDVVVGENGLGWGVGTAGKQPSFPEKKEGDHRAPAGLFGLVKAMGYDRSPPEGSPFPYEQIKQVTHCVDDPGSPLYNRIVKESDFTVPTTELWHSSERMKRTDNLYRRLVVVDYNMRKPQPGGGSCIFLHIWRSPTTGTAGCTAMTEKDLADILRWLKTEANPAIVQLPKPVYDSYWKTWQLPPPELLADP